MEYFLSQLVDLAIIKIVKSIDAYVGDSMYVRTTVKLREDIYQILKKGSRCKRNFRED
jgi:hypothetical protein